MLIFYAFHLFCPVLSRQSSTVFRYIIAFHNFFKKAAAASGMAGCTDLIHPCQDRIVITIQIQ